MRGRIAAAIAVFMSVFCLLAGVGSGVAYAKDNASESSFLGDLELLKQEDDNYVLQVTVENRGEDFTGTVQLVFGGYYANCAYNTELTLPAQGRKQFTVTVPARAVDTTRGNCNMNILDEKGEQLQTIAFKNVFGALRAGISVGILSDNFDQLGFMDAGGTDFYIRGDSYPIQLIELDGDKLRDYLDGLYFLVIDQFNVSSLKQEDIRAIQDWVMDGGWLLIGTGACAEQTLSGFDTDFLDLTLTAVSEPGEKNEAKLNADKYGYYYSYVDAGVDFGNMSIAQLNFNNLMGNDYESAQNPAIINSGYGKGAVAVYFFSFGDPELQALGDYTIQYMYEELMYQSNSYQSFGGSSDMEYVGQGALACIDNSSTELNFFWLKVLIGIYVVLAGPVLYLILRRSKRSEWYWVGVPALGLVFILVVFAFGAGSRVNGTRVYSVTVQRTDSPRMDTYFLGYHAGTKPWSITLREDYEVGGPGWSGYSYYSDPGDYTCFVTNDSRGMSIGLKPRENFESGYLYASGRAEKKGSFTLPYNVVTNNTGYDLAYMAVWYDSHIVIYEDVRAGEAVNLQQSQPDHRLVYEDMSVSDVYDLRYMGVSGYYRYGKKEEYQQEDMSALIVGLGVAHDENPSEAYGIVAGVVKDYDKAVTSKCDETAYGCLYTFIEMGVGTDAAN